MSDKFKEIYDEHGPSANGFKFMDFSNLDKNFPASD